MAEKDLKDVVKDKYGKAALRVTAGGDASCCDSAASRGERDPITSNLYACGETSELPAEAVAASLGCGNPTALARLNAGEIVLDLAGIEPRERRRVAAAERLNAGEIVLDLAGI